MKYPRILGISGNRGVGKDTLFQSLNNVHLKEVPIFRRYAFADALKRDLESLLKEQFGVDIWNVTGENKELIRPILIAYGCAWRALDPDHWVKKVINSIKRDEFISAQHIPVITDIRFENEGALLKKTFGDRFFHVDLVNTEAPEPTEEEKKHYLKVAHQADFQLVWGDDTPAEINDLTRYVLKSADIKIE